MPGCIRSDENATYEPIITKKTDRRICMRRRNIGSGILVWDHNDFFSP